MKSKTHITSIALGVLFSVFVTALAAHAQDKIVRVQTLQDAWQVRRAETRAFITAIGDEKATHETQAAAPVQCCAGVHESPAIRLHIVNTSESAGFFAERVGSSSSQMRSVRKLSGAPLLDIKRAEMAGLDQGQAVSMIIVLIAEKTELQPA
ncbi:hypothetical protein QFZ42_003540 [Variovorax paradoxus]|uniref:hypothetical protein n=1 Tax=Variovorax paradoxus TaxID=34073 RepID=UPI002792DDBC|nr:hypothetical protein [Variovorax paradoxus]MDQ0571706.1 hypothetical protein [Variovorax paradoxus]